ncbi:MAG: hypothetical protein KTR20_05840, partial [Cellvibrionaceae bacterium]|nr:hypothetical protein [Cellvibrionaceae bacterium]
MNSRDTLSSLRTILSSPRRRGSTRSASEQATIQRFTLKNQQSLQTFTPEVCIIAQVSVIR